MKGDKEITLADVVIGMARKYNHYEESEERIIGRTCQMCVRRRFSYPYSCNDGWPCGNQNWNGTKGETCLNWSDTSDCPC